MRREFWKVYNLKLQASARWKTCNEMFTKLLHVRSVLTTMLHVSLIDKEDRIIDHEFEQPKRQQEVLNNLSFCFLSNTFIKMLT